jgi:TetR/AcrR family transcriptional regulator, transcriptional repressor for nem operon
MARPRGYEIDDVLANAMHVFWRQGFANASMSDIYAATGLKPGNLYATFTDKDTLFRRAFETYAAQFRATLPQEATGRAAVEEWLHTQARLALDDPDRKGCLIVNTMTEREAHAPETRSLASARMAEITAFFRDNLAIARGRGEIAATADVEHLAAAMTGAVVAIMALARGGASDAAIRAVADHAIASLPRDHD